MSCGVEEKQMNDVEQQKVKRRALQTQHQATLSGLFEELKNMVCPSSQSSHNCEELSHESSHAKWKILDHAMGFLLEKEAYLSKLLALKELYLDDDEGPKNLEEVREQYRMLYSKHVNLHSRRPSHTACLPDLDEGQESSEVDLADEESEELPQSQLSSSSVSNIQEFDGYLRFYNETLEQLLHSGMFAPDETDLSVVSEAISGLWNSLLQEQRAEDQQNTLDQSSVLLEGQTEIATSPLARFDPSASFIFEEDLLQDAYDVVQSEMNAPSVNRPAALPIYEHKKLWQIYTDISGCIKNHLDNDQDIPQDLSQAADYDEQYLKCFESIDEDF